MRSRIQDNEVAKFVTEPNLGQQTNPMFMNLRTWNSLTDEQREMFGELNREFAIRMAKATIDDAKNAVDRLMNNPRYPMDVIELSKEERGQFEVGLRIAERHSVESSSKSNPAAEKIYEAFSEALEEVRNEVDEHGYPWD